MERLVALPSDPRGRLNEALAILTRLQSDGRLPAAQQGWIDRIKGAIAKLPQDARSN